MASCLLRTRPTIRPRAESRQFTDAILHELAHAHWSLSGWAQMLRRSGARSWRQAAERPAATTELVVGHAIVFAMRPTAWPLAAWLMAATHVGLLSDATRALGGPNRLTLLRANLPAVVAPPAPWTAVVALATDWADGSLARRSRKESAFGAYADVLADAAFWTWFAVHHEPNRLFRATAVCVWAAPVAWVTALFFAHGGAVAFPRFVAVRNLSVAVQLAIGMRSVTKAFRGR